MEHTWISLLNIVQWSNHNYLLHHKGRPMKPLASILIVFLALALLVPTAQAATSTSVIPTFDIVSVVVDTSVTIKTANYPKNDKFDVYMNTLGTKGVGGVKVATVDTGAGGSLTFTFNIPDSLKGLNAIAIRLQSPTSGYFSYNWFYNKTGGSSGGTTTPPGPIPTFSILSVEKDSKVTIRTANFPKNLKFDVLMGKYGTKGVGGTNVGTIDSGSGGTLDFTFNIPDGLKGLDRIAIRTQSQTTGHFSYNWFWNAPSSSGSTGSPGLPAGVYPTFSISAVAKDASVTIKTANLPANDKFDVYMNTYGTKGVGGVKVTSFDTGSGGTQTLTFTIPDGLKGLDRIAIRIQSPTSGYFAFNWFWNNNAP